jgi:hypothetical protein
MTGPSRLRGGVCGVSTMISERLAKPFHSLGSTGTRSRPGADRGYWPRILCHPAGAKGYR